MDIALCSEQHISHMATEATRPCNLWLLLLVWVLGLYWSFWIVRRHLWIFLLVWVLCVCTWASERWDILVECTVSFFQYSPHEIWTGSQKSVSCKLYCCWSFIFTIFSHLSRKSPKSVCGSIAVTFRLYDLRETGYIEREEVLEHPAFLFLLSTNVLNRLAFVAT